MLREQGQQPIGYPSQQVPKGGRQWVAGGWWMGTGESKRCLGPS